MANYDLNYLAVITYSHLSNVDPYCLDEQPETYKLNYVDYIIIQLFLILKIYFSSPLIDTQCAIKILNKIIELI